MRKERTGEERLQALLRDIGGNWTKSKPKPRVLTAEEKEIKLHLENAANWWKDWLFQMGWYALEWVEPMSRGENPKYCHSSHIVMKPTPRAHWIGHAKVRANNPKFTQTIGRETADAAGSRKLCKVMEAILEDYYRNTNYIIP